MRRQPLKLPNYSRKPSTELSVLHSACIGHEPFQHAPWGADEIFSNLYLGDLKSSHDKENIERHGITAVVRVLSIEGSGELQKFPGIDYMDIDLLDIPSANIRDACRQAYKFIFESQSQGKKVLVHCHAGVSRSATVVISYLMKTLKWDYDKALNFVQSRRKQVCPNLGFCMYLITYKPTPTETDRAPQPLPIPLPCQQTYL